jgi:hypothetical protein
MNKLVKDLIIGIVVAIGSYFVVQGLAKQSAQVAYNEYMENEQKDYEAVQVDNSDSLDNKFINNLPYFTLNLPEGLSLIKFFDNDGVVGYVGETDTIICQLQVIDIYTLGDVKGKKFERRMHDYNMYSKKTMGVAHDGLVKSTIANSPYGDVINVEHFIQKINNIIFIYIEYEIPDDNENMMRKSYNFLINGYTIAVVGLYLKNDADSEITVDNYLKSIRFD